MVPPSANVLSLPHYKDNTSVRHMQIKKVPRITAKDIQPQIYRQKKNYLDINSLSKAFQPYRIM